MTNTVVSAWLRHAIVNVRLATRSCEPNGTSAFEAIYHVQTGATVQARFALTFIYIDFTLRTCEAYKKNYVIKTIFIKSIS